jgi:hypothetical protein
MRGQNCDPSIQKLKLDEALGGFDSTHERLLGAA